MNEYLPVTIANDNKEYVGFIKIKELPHIKYYRKFMGTKYPFVEKAKYSKYDFVYMMTPFAYFRLSCALKESGKKYNINKFRHKLNGKKRYWYSRFLQIFK